MTHRQAYSDSQQNDTDGDPDMAEFEDLVERTVMRVLPGIVETVTRRVVAEAMVDFRHEVSSAIAGVEEPGSDRELVGVDPVLDSRGRVIVSDEFLRDGVAVVFRDAMMRGAHPNQAVQDRYGRSRSSVSQWLKKARAAGHLPEATQGKATT